MGLSTSLAVLSRIVAVVLGGYAATVGTVALAAVLLALGCGMQRSEAITLTTMIGFIGYAAIIIWGFAEPRLVRLWAVLGGVAIASNLAAIWLARLLPPAPPGG